MSRGYLDQRRTEPDLYFLLSPFCATPEEKVHPQPWMAYRVRLPRARLPRSQNRASRPTVNCYSTCAARSPISCIATRQASPARSPSASRGNTSMSYGIESECSLSRRSYRLQPLHTFVWRLSLATGTLVPGGWEEVIIRNSFR